MARARAMFYALHAVTHPSLGSAGLGSDGQSCVLACLSRGLHYVSTVHLCFIAIDVYALDTCCALLKGQCEIERPSGPERRRDSSR